MYVFFMFFFFKQKTAYEMRISDWSSDVCSSDLLRPGEMPHVGKIGRDTTGKVGRHHRRGNSCRLRLVAKDRDAEGPGAICGKEIGRASCRERVCQYV